MGNSKQEMELEFVRERANFGDEERIIIGVTRDKIDAEVIIKGPANFNELQPGGKYTFFGRWKTHPQYGKQFLFDNFQEASVGKDKHSIVNYLVSRKMLGVGPAIALKLYDTYGEDAIEVLRDDPKRAASEIPRLGVASANNASSKLNRGKKNATIKGELLTFLKNHRVPKKVIDSLITTHGTKAIAKIKENPYGLMQYKGIGFLLADAVFLENGGDPKSMERQARCIAYEIQSKTDGDIWYERPFVVGALNKYISGAAPTRDEAIKTAIDMNLIVERKYNGVKWYAGEYYARLERELSEKVAELASIDGHYPDLDGLPLSKHQLDELKGALQKRIGCFSGSPGTGKTYSIALLVRQIQEMNLGRIAIITPTGKAAVRASEAMTKEGVDATAQTAYSYLGYDGSGFRKGPGDTIEDEYVLVDESSMNDLVLTHAIVTAAGPKTHFLFIGDIHQLPPVGPGAPYRDMIQSGIVPTGMLTEVRRNSGDIVASCASVRDGEGWTCSKGDDLERGENLQFIQTGNPEQSLVELESLYDRLKDHELDLVWDVQPLAPLNKNSAIGRAALNKVLQEKLNPKGMPIERTEFRIGDKVVNNKNADYLAQEYDGEKWVSSKEDGKSESMRHRVANGEQGEIIDVAPGRIIARVLTPTRIVAIPQTKSKDDENEDEGSKSNWELGYVMTVHKSQGSEWAVSILLVDHTRAAGRVQTMNWLITGQSRTKQHGYVIGDRSIIRKVSKTAGLNRKTFLAERIGEVYEADRDSESIRNFTMDDFFEILDGVI